MKKVYSDLKSVRSWTGRTHFFYDEGKTPVSHRDREYLEFYFTLLPFVVEDLLPDFSRVSRTLKSCIEDRFYSDSYCNFLKDTANLIRRYCNGDCGFPGYDEYRRMYREVPFSHFIMAALKPLWEEIRTVKYSAIFSALTIVEFGVKMNLLDLDIQEKLLLDYCIAESEMADWTYEADDLASVRCILREWLGNSPDYSAFRPKHGPGAVAESVDHTSQEAKASVFGVDSRIKFCDLDQFLFNPSDHLSRCSRLIFVPKSMNTNRSISAEPATLQYLQQGVSKLLMEKYYETNGRRGIYLPDQSRSQELARSGSYFGEYGTIDLSAASDSVTWELVKSVFPPKWRYLLWATRSTHTQLPDGRPLALRKFAPMGSACCFPVESLIFGAVFESCRRECGKRAYWRVYGDDGVVPESYIQQAISKLERLNFTVNIKKTFTGTHLHNFREACGIECLDGIDVTPVRLSRWMRWERYKSPAWFRTNCPNEFYRGNTDRLPTDPAMLIGLVNRLEQAGLYRSRAAVMRLWKMDCLDVNQDPWLGIPFSSNGAVGIKDRFGDIRNLGNVSRYNSSLQRAEMAYALSINVADMIGLIHNDGGNDDYRYFEWLVRYGRKDRLDEQKIARLPIEVGSRASVDKLTWVDVQ